jgi:hypothetical protein
VADAFTAWKTLGWTAQNMAYPVEDPPVVVSPPAGVEYLTLKGRYHGTGGNVRVRSPGAIVARDVVLPPFDARFDVVAGVATVVLPRPADPDIVWEYHVTEAFPGGRKFLIRLDSAAMPETTLRHLALELDAEPLTPVVHEGVTWFYGDGPPGHIPEANPGDKYLDNLTGDVYTFGGA